MQRQDGYVLFVHCMYNVEVLNQQLIYVGVLMQKMSVNQNQREMLETQHRTTIN